MQPYAGKRWPQDVCEGMTGGCSLKRHLALLKSLHYVVSLQTHPWMPPLPPTSESKGGPKTGLSFRLQLPLERPHRVSPVMVGLNRCGLFTRVQVSKNA